MEQTSWCLVPAPLVLLAPLALLALFHQCRRLPLLAQSVPLVLLVMLVLSVRRGLSRRHLH